MRCEITTAIPPAPDKSGRDELAETLLLTLGPRLRELRLRADLTLEGLASRAGVSRSMISKIERGEKMPTVGILVRIALGLNVTLTSLLDTATASAPAELQRATSHSRFRDPSSGLEREVIFSPGDGETELVRHSLPGLRATGELAPYPVPTQKLVFALTGPLVVAIGTETHLMQPGDTLRFDVTRAYSFANPAETPVSYHLLMTRPRVPSGGIG